MTAITSDLNEIYIRSLQSRKDPVLCLVEAIERVTACKMGSLMAGWQSRVSDPEVVKYKRNKSLTKEGIEAYWRSKKAKEDEHLRAISDLSPKSQVNIIKESEIVYRRSSSLPLPNAKENFLDMETESSLEKPLQKNGWWISSNSAFLNEPPVIASDGPTPSHKYAAQFHVASTSGSKPCAPTGISA